MDRPVNKSTSTGITPRDIVAAKRTAAMRPRQARVLGSFLAGLTRKAFEKHGFSTVALLTDWASIVGSDLAVYSVPERLKWQKGVDAYGAVEDGAERRPGATLMLRVEGSRAIEVQMRARQIIERINAYFGYRAVAEIRIVQGPVARPAVEARKTEVELTKPASPEVTRVGDPALREALARLEANIEADRRR
jgi:hypothetical protein